MIVNWNCPDCLATNNDDYSQTVRPMCGECGIDFDWGEVLDPGEISNLNTALEDRGREQWKAELRELIAGLESRWEELDQEIEAATTRHQRETGQRNLGLTAGKIRQGQKEIEEKLARYRRELEQLD